MKIKLSSQESRRRIQQLNSRLKILTSDIKGQSNTTFNNNYQLPQSQYCHRLKKNYFHSSANLNSVSPLQPNTDSEYGIADYHPQSPKFSASPHQKYKVISQRNPIKEYSPLSQGRNNKNVRVQLENIIQSKKQFHSLIKKELSQLQKLQQSIIEQPQKWDSSDKCYDEHKDKGYDGSGQEDKSKSYNNEGKLMNRKESERMNERQRLFPKNILRGNPSNDMQFKEIQQKGSLKNFQSIRIKEEHVVVSRERNPRSWGLMGTKTEQSINQESQYQQRDDSQQQSEAYQQQSPNNQHYQAENPSQQMPYFTPQHLDSLQNNSFQPNGKNIQIDERNNINNCMSRQSLPFNRQQVESLLHQLMIVDYSDQNILSIMKLVEEESLRRSTINREKSNQSMRNSSRSINENTHGNHEQSIKVSNCVSRENPSMQLRNKSYLHQPQPSLLLSPANSSLSNFPSEIKEFSLEQEEQRHYQLIHSYKLLSLILKIKHFSTINHNLSLNLTQNNKINKATTFRNHHLYTKSFSQFKQHAEQSYKEQQALYEIKSINVKKMLKKNIILQFVHNSNSKTFKFLANKLKYQRQLNVKNKALGKFFREKEEVNKEEQLSKLSDDFSKKSLFRTIKERYQRIRNTYSKYLLLKSINRHRHWNQLTHILNFYRLKIIVQKQSTQGKGNNNNINTQNQILEPSSDMDGKILNQLEKYSKAFCQLHYQCLEEKDEEITTRSADLLIKFTEPIVLRIKQSTLQNYLKLKLKKQWIGRFIEDFVFQRKKKEIKFQNQQKTQNITHNIIAFNRKQQLINKLKLNFQQNTLNRKTQYFCNMTIGSVPKNLKLSKAIPKQQKCIAVTINNFIPVSLHDQQQDYFQDTHSVINDQELCFSEGDKTAIIIKGLTEDQRGMREEQCRSVNPLLIKYLKGVFLKRLRKFFMESQKKKLEKQVYFKTIYGGNLLKKCIKGWRIVLKQQTIERKRQQQRRKQLQQQQRRQQTIQKQQQLLILKQIQQQSLKLKQHQTIIKQQETLLQNKICQLKRQQRQLQSLQLQKKEQLRIEAQKQRLVMLGQQHEVKQRLRKLRIEQLRQIQKLKEIEENIENRKQIEQEQQKKYIQEKEERRKKALIQEERRKSQIQEEERKIRQIKQKDRKRRQIQAEERRKISIQEEKRIKIEDERKRSQMKVDKKKRQKQEESECKLKLQKLDLNLNRSKQALRVQQLVKGQNDKNQESIHFRDDQRQQGADYQDQQLMQDELSEETQIKESKMEVYSRLSGNAQIKENWLTKRSEYGQEHQQSQSQQQQNHWKHETDQHQLSCSRLDKSSSGKKEYSGDQDSFNQQPEQQKQKYKIQKQTLKTQNQHQHQHEQQNIGSYSEHQQYSQQQPLDPSFAESQQSNQILSNYLQNQQVAQKIEKEKENQHTPAQININTPKQINLHNPTHINQNDSSYSQIEENNSYLIPQDLHQIDNQNNESQPSQQNQDLQSSMNHMMDWLGNKIKVNSSSLNIKINPNSQGNNKQVSNKNNSHNQIISKYLHHDLPLQVRIQSNQNIFDSPSHDYNNNEISRNDNPSSLLQRQQKHQAQVRDNQDQDSDIEDQEDASFLKMLKQQHSPNNSDHQQSNEGNIDSSEDQSDQLQEKQHSEPQEEKYFLDLQQDRDQHSSNQQQHASEYSESKNNTESQAQAQSSDSQAQSSVSQLQASNSPQHLRLLSYAQNHHSLFMKRLIFNQFKYQSYKQQQNQDFTLLRTVFTNWKLFHQQKHSLKKYLQIYQNFTQRINQDKVKEPIPYKNSTKSIKRQSAQSQEKKNNKHNQQAMITKSQEKSHRQEQSQQRFSNIKFYPNSKEDLQTFRNLYPSNQFRN